MIFGEVQSLLFSSLILPGARRALYLHGEPERIMRHPVTGRLVGWPVRRVICVSEFLTCEVRHTPLRRLPLSVVHNGTTLPAIRDRAPASGAVRLGVVGRISKQKRHARLLDALAQLTANSFHLYIVGGSDRTLQDQVAVRGLTSHVTWTGFIGDRAAIYAGLDIVVAPAVDEGFGMTVVEAGAFGLPVIAARSGAFPELIRHGETGLLVEPGDAGSMARALQRLIGDAALCDRMGRAERTHVAANFTVEKMADRFVVALG